MNRFFRTIVAPALAAAFLCLFSAAAPAVAGTIATPADKFVMAPGGVDMRTGRYAYKQNDLAIGGTDESGGIAFTRILQADVLGHLNPFGNFSDNWDIMVSERRININDPSQEVGTDYRIMIHFGGRSKTFEAYDTVSGFSERGNGPYGTLTYTGDRAGPSVVYTYTAPDGTVAVFRPLGNGDCSNQVRCAYVSSVTEPDGTTFTFSYAATGGADAVRLSQVTSSRGYALVIEGGNLVTKACVLNLTQTTVPANGLCPANALATASYTYNTSDPSTPRLASATRPNGGVESFAYSSVTPSGLVMAFTKPGQSAPWLTNTVFFQNDENGVLQELVSNQAFVDGQSYSYSFSSPPPTDTQPVPPIIGGTYIDALGNRTDVLWDFPPTPGGAQISQLCHAPCYYVTADQILNRPYQITLGPVQVVDPIGRTTTADYCDPTVEAGLPSTEHYRCMVIPMVSFTDPEGVKTDLTYDGALNITRAVRHAKPGSGLADIVTSATFDITKPKYQSKPLTTTDGNGNVTTYTYDPNHGGVLTETDPAVNGVTPQKRYTYAQRTAWISNGAGGWVAAGPPVWVLTQMSFCKAGNPGSGGVGCANGPSDEVITTYDYGPDAGPNNLILRGTVVGAGGLSLRTCTSYDALGNKISETKPRAGLASCP